MARRDEVVSRGSFRWEGRRGARFTLGGSAAVALLGVCLSVGSTAAQQVTTDRVATDQALLLEVHVNGHPTGKIGEFVLRSTRGSNEPKLLLRRNEMRDLGFRTPVRASPIKSRQETEANDLLELSTIDGLTWRIDAATQSLFVIVAEERLLPTMVRPDELQVEGGRFHLESSTGVTFNYDVDSLFTEGVKTFRGSLDARAFSPRGVISTGLLGYVSNTRVSSSLKNSLIRLDTTYSYADPVTLRRYSLGDFITSGLSWTRPIRMEGVQVRSDFSMRPDLVTFPLPTVNGSVAVPSTINVMANGNFLLSQQIDPGPFEIPQLPVSSGAGTITLNVVNALGQPERITQSFYASSALLRPGLRTFAAQAGLVRRNWGAVSNQYGQIAATGTFRRGVTNRFTVEAAAEAARGVLMAGGGGVFQVGNLGVSSFSADVSFGSRGTGVRVSAGFQRIGRMLSAGGSVAVAGQKSTDLAARNGDPAPTRQASGNLSFTLRRYGSTGIYYAALDVPSATNPYSHLVTAAEHSRILSLGYSVPVRGAYVYANAFKSFADNAGLGVQFGLTVPLGHKQSAEASAGSGGMVEVQAQRSATSIGDWGYQAYVSKGVTLHEFGELQRKARAALVSVGVDSNGGVLSIQAKAQGAVSFLDRRMYLSNTIYDSFAVVDTGKIGPVRVLQENRDVGVTDASGRLLVPDLRSFDLNHLAVLPTDISVDRTIEHANQEVRPGDRTGVVVRFETTVSHAAVVSLVDEAGQAIPVGSTVRLLGTGQLVPVGYDGVAYVENLETRSRIEVTRPDGTRCTAEIRYQPVAGDIPNIGPLTCLAEKMGGRP